jgi:Tfp pilus assembly protein PilZ
MELRLSSDSDFLKIWKNGFLGQKGLFIPGEKYFPLGQEFTITIYIDNETLGSALVKPVWCNLSGPVNPDLPRGTFLKIIRAEKNLQLKINCVCS